MENSSQLFSYSSIKGAKLEEFDFSSEAALQGYIEENPAVLVFRQGDTARIESLEKSWVRGTGRGRIDFLVSYDESYAVVELKKGILDKDALDQLTAYLSPEYFKKAEAELFRDKELPKSINWEGVLVGTDLSLDLLDRVKEHNESHKDIPVSVIVVKRYRSGDQIFFKADAYSFSKSKRDYSKWLINGKLETDKSKSVLNMVREYVNEHKNLTIHELKTLLEPLALGRRKKYPLVVDVSDIGVSIRENGYYTESAVKLSDGSVAVMGYWTIDEMPHVQKVAEAFKYKIERMA